MKCPNCGMVNPEKMRFCGNCGKALPSEGVITQEQGVRQCVECGRSIAWDANACMYCGHDYRKRAKPGTEGYLTTGAVLTVLAGVLGLLLLSVIVDASHFMSTSQKVILAIMYVCSGLGVVGGIAALVRKMFPIAVLGSACAIFTPAFFFAVPGLVLVARAAAEFKDYKTGP